MKKYFRLLGVALIATSMCLVSCGGDENDENGTNGNNENVTPGVEVTFAGQTWQADYISALTNGTAIQIIATPASGLTNINCVDENQQVIGTGKFAEPCLKIQSVAQQGEMSVQGADLENADFLVTYMVTKDNDFYFFSSASSTT
ncbi:MAG: hypothetical protein IKX51_02375, partial [Bacteroidales bacterium]|nr:hypothetical protein [Bacteroidales bacterium]